MAVDVVDAELLAQYVRIFLANRRQGTAAVKTRGEVSGGGKKPWRQKGTGRARAGSIRSPLWVGGGATHAPKPKDWSLSLSPAMRRRALFTALSQRSREGQVIVLDKLPSAGIKTKELVKSLARLPVGDKILLVLPREDREISLSARNVPGLRIVVCARLNAYDVLWAKTVLLPREVLPFFKVLAHLATESYIDLKEVSG